MEQIFVTPLLREEIEHLDPRSAQLYRIELRASDGLSVWANESFVRQVMRNLLSNALKYSSAQTTITVSASDDGNEVCMQVKDEGDGIPQDEMPLLFGKFVRLARHHAGSIRGTGLGSTLVNRWSRRWVDASG